MRKFGHDLLEVFKDIKHGAFYGFRACVLFFWWIGVVVDEQSTRFVKCVKAKCKKSKPATTDVEITVFNTKEKALSCS